MDEPPEEPLPSADDNRQLRRWLWALWIGTGVFLVAQALVVPIILNDVLIAVWLLGNIAQLIVTLHRRKNGVGPGQGH